MVIFQYFLNGIRIFLQRISFLELENGNIIYIISKNYLISMIIKKYHLNIIVDQNATILVLDNLSYVISIMSLSTFFSHFFDLFLILIIINYFLNNIFIRGDEKLEND